MQIRRQEGVSPAVRQDEGIFAQAETNVLGWERDDLRNASDVTERELRTQQPRGRPCHARTLRIQLHHLPSGYCTLQACGSKEREDEAGIPDGRGVGGVPNTCAAPALRAVVWIRRGAYTVVGVCV